MRVVRLSAKVATFTLGLSRAPDLDQLVGLQTGLVEADTVARICSPLTWC
jgi:hypothetical protein